MKRNGELNNHDAVFNIFNGSFSELLIDFVAEKYSRGLGRQASDIYEIIATIKERAKLNPDRKFKDIVEEYLDELFMKKSASASRRDPIYNPSVMMEIIKHYSWILDKSHALDFMDMLVRALDLFRAAPWIRELRDLKHVLVDEL
jgi:superfamily I DNA/RNA helicase